MHANETNDSQSADAAGVHPAAIDVHNQCDASAVARMAQRTGLSASDTGPPPVLSDFQTCAHCDG